MANDISFIANSGIQFYKFDFTVDNNADVIKTMGFYEDLDNDYKIELSYAYYLPEDDTWVPKRALKELNIIDEAGNLLQNTNLDFIVSSLKLKEGQDYFTRSDITDALSIFTSKEEENIWLPIPYFKFDKTTNQSKIGPFAWARMTIRETKKERTKTTYQVVLAFDTQIEDSSTGQQDEFYFRPKRRDTMSGNNSFTFCNNEDLNLLFCSEKHHCGWVKDYIRELYLNRGETISETERPFMKDLHNFLYFLKYMGSLKDTFPLVTLYPEDRMPIDVDLVLDIGNANTCGLLVENPTNNITDLEFKKVKKLRIQDLSQPNQYYEEPFSMRLAFSKTNFGGKLIHREDNKIIIQDLVPNIINEDKRPFQWPSILRIGNEAHRLISKHNIDINTGVETANHHSSPKRYIWDRVKSEVEWQFVNEGGASLHRTGLYITGLNNLFSENGELITDNTTSGAKYLYSRSSLMTFVYIEIFLHALTQINSYDFRRNHGDPERPRKLKRITITCPTSIIQYEQVMLRKYAEDALAALSKFFPNMLEIEIIPSPKELSRNLSMVNERKDWIYDEATCGQLVFLYSEVSKRYLNKADVFFNLYGKKRDDVDNVDKKALTIGSIDIGGGTTDLMICAYQYAEGQGQAVIKPHPLYWESFNLAGDDLLKNIIKQIILEGESNNEEEREHSGIIKNALKQKGIDNVTEKLLAFFGTDSNSQSYLQRIYRKNFITQVAIPIALRCLNHASDEMADDEIVLRYDDFFPDIKPNANLIFEFNKHFNETAITQIWRFRLEDIEWKISKEKVGRVVENFFDPLLKQLSVIISAYGCDFVLTAGRPTTIPKVRELLVKYYVASPDRIINMHTYRIGRWYPYANEKGYINNPKTVVAVGALIGLMGGKLGRLEGFKLDTNYLKRKLISTSDYIGTIEKATKNIKNIFLSPDKNTEQISVHSLPMLIGYKQLPNEHYHARPIYKLDYDLTMIEERIKMNNPTLNNDTELQSLTRDYKEQLSNRYPFQIKIKRQWSESKEKISIEGIRDSNGNDISNKILKFFEMTLLEEQGYWLDTGEFYLNIQG